MVSLIFTLSACVDEKIEPLENPQEPLENPQQDLFSIFYENDEYTILKRTNIYEGMIYNMMAYLFDEGDNLVSDHFGVLIDIEIL